MIVDVANGIAAANTIPAANVSIASVHRLIVADDAGAYYRDIGRTISVERMHYNSVMSNFVDWEAYKDLKKQDKPDVPLMNDRDKEKSIIKWAPLF